MRHSITGWVSRSLACLALGFSAPVLAQDASKPVVIELFTSQSCYSCPPAEEYLGELAERPGVIALEWHVDYWDTLVYGSAGRWKDPFSSPDYTARQSAYNYDIHRSRRIYTPQMVINGAAEAVGSRRHDVERTINEVAATNLAADIDIVRGAENNLTIDVTGEATERASVFVVHYIRAHTTEVLRGENHGKTLTNHNIVTEVERLADWRGGSLSFTIAAPKADKGCAILIQSEPVGVIQAAQSCDSAITS